MEARVAAWLAEQGALSVTGIKPLAGGACQDNFVITTPQARMVLRSDARSSLPGSLSRREEFAIIEAAVAAARRAHGIPGTAVPVVDALVQQEAAAVRIDGRAGDVEPHLAGAKRGEGESDGEVGQHMYVSGALANCARTASSRRNS